MQFITKWQNVQSYLEFWLSKGYNRLELSKEPDVGFKLFSSGLLTWSALATASFRPSKQILKPGEVKS